VLPIPSPLATRLAKTINVVSESLAAVADNPRTAGTTPQGFMDEAVLDEGYHSNETLPDLHAIDARAHWVGATELGRQGRCAGGVVRQPPTDQRPPLLAGLDARTGAAQERPQATAGARRRIQPGPCQAPADCIRQATADAGADSADCLAGVGDSGSPWGKTAS